MLLDLDLNFGCEFEIKNLEKGGKNEKDKLKPFTISIAAHT